MVNQSYQVSRPLHVLFYDNSSHRAGRQDFCNIIARISKLLTFDWYFIPQKPDLLQIMLKNCLFKYPSTDRSTALTSAFRSNPRQVNTGCQSAPTQQQQCRHTMKNYPYY